MDRTYKVFLLSFFLFSLASSPLLKSSEAIDAQKLLEQVDEIFGLTRSLLVVVL